MINKVVHSKSLKQLNSLIVEENKKGWVVKQIYVNGDGDPKFTGKYSGVFALLEKDGSWK